jgi:hypothetical protein
MLRPAYLCQKLDQPLPTKDGGVLRTIREAVNYMTGIGSRALELALFMDAKLDVSKVPAK